MEFGELLWANLAREEEEEEEEGGHVGSGWWEERWKRMKMHALLVHFNTLLEAMRRSDLQPMIGCLTE